MWIGLWSSAEVRVVVTEGNIMEGEEGGWTVREMRDYQTIWLTAMFMQYNKVCEFFCPACFCNVADNMCPPIDPS